MSLPSHTLKFGLWVAILPVIIFITFALPAVAKSDESSDFYADVQNAVRDTSIDSSTFLARESLAQAEYTSSWDQFGTSALIDGTAPSEDVNAAIAEDVAASTASEQHYDQAEVSYLTDIQSSPEQVLGAEQKSGSDVPPAETFDPNPSLAENPNVNATAAEDIAPETVASAVTESGTPSGDESTNADTSTSAGNTEQSAYEAIVTGDVPTNTGDQTSPDASPDGSNTSSDNSGASAAGADVQSSNAGSSAPDSSDAGSSNAGSSDSGSSDAGASDSGSSDAGSSSGGDSSGDTGGSGDSGASTGDSPASAALGAEHASKIFQAFVNTLFGFFRSHL